MGILLEANGKREVDVAARPSAPTLNQRAKCHSAPSGILTWQAVVSRHLRQDNAGEVDDDPRMVAACQECHKPEMPNMRYFMIML